MPLWRAARHPPRKVWGVICTRQFADDPRKHVISARAASSSAVASDIDTPGFVSRGPRPGGLLRRGPVPQPLQRRGRLTSTRPGFVSRDRGPASCFRADRFLSRRRGGADYIDTPRIRKPLPGPWGGSSVRQFLCHCQRRGYIDTPDSSAVARGPGRYRRKRQVLRRCQSVRPATATRAGFVSGCQQARSARSTRASSVNRCPPDALHPQDAGVVRRCLNWARPTGARRIRQRLRAARRIMSVQPQRSPGPSSVVPAWVLRPRLRA
jgi:hypothetical protein